MASDSDISLDEISIESKSDIDSDSDDINYSINITHDNHNKNNFMINNFMINNFIKNNSLENLSISPLNNNSYSFKNSESNYNRIDNNSTSSTNSDTEYKTCKICYEDFEDICLLRCNHVLCLKCFVSWFSENTTCPFCRLNIDNLDIHNLQLSNSIDSTDSLNSHEYTNCNKIEKIICYISLTSWLIYLIVYKVPLLYL